MIAVYRRDGLAEVVDAAVPESAFVTADWAAFEQSARRAECVVVAFEHLEPPCSEDALAALGRLDRPPLILVTAATTEPLSVLAHITCFGCGPLGEVETHLKGVIENALGRSPRHRAATEVLRRIRPDPIAERIVHEVLVADEPVPNVAALVDRMSDLLVNDRFLRRRWNAAIQPARCPLHGFVRRARLLRAVEYLAAGSSVVSAEVQTRIDESTLYANLREIGVSVRSPGRELVMAAARELLRCFESDGESASNGGRRWRRYASTASSRLLIELGH
jgi:hypothetical protein